MKILQVTTVAATLNAFLLPFATAFRQQGWQVDAAASNICDVESVIAAHDNCFDIQFCRNPLQFRQLYQSLKTMRRLLQTQQYDIVHVHTPIAAFLTRIAAIGIRQTKIFYTAHGFHYVSTNPRWKNALFYLAEKIAGYRTDHLFVINQADFIFAKQKRIVAESAISYIHGIGVDPIYYLANAAMRQQTRDALAISNTDFMLLHVAELNHNKNHQVVLHALALLKQQYPDSNVRYVIAGEGGNLALLQALAVQLGLDACVLFLGQRKDIPALLAACDSLCLSSLREGLPRCMLEAMCMSRAMIASDGRGCADLLATGAGLLVPYNDAQAWADGIHQLVSQPGLRRTMGELGAALIEQYYQQDRVVADVLAIYQRELNL